MQPQKPEQQPQQTGGQPQQSGGPQKTVVTPEMALALGLSREEKTRKKLNIGLVVGAVVFVLLIIGGFFFYRHHQQRVAEEGFKNVVLQFKQQELAGAKNYIELQTTLNHTRPILSVAFGTFNNKYEVARVSDQLNVTNSNLQAIVASACTRQSDDITEKSITKQLDSLALSSAQTRYINDLKSIVGGLNNSLYSNQTICADGKAFISVYDRVIQLLPGLQVVTNLGKTLDRTPSADQAEILKGCQDVDFKNRSILQNKLPQTYFYLANLKASCVTAYKKFDALKRNDKGSAKKYSKEFDNLLFRVDDNSAMQGELDNFNQALKDTVIKASLAEIAAINYQQAHNLTDSELRLNYQLPVFRLAEAAIINYAHNNDGKVPFGNNVQDISNLTSYMQKLKEKHLLKFLDYRALGDARKGFVLSVKLSDGTELIDRINPPSSQPVL